MNKTKELIADFRRLGHTHSHRTIKIHDEMVEIVCLVHLYKYLRMIFEDTLKWDLNTEVIRKDTSDSISCGISDRLTLISSSSCFTTLLFGMFWPFLSFAFFFFFFFNNLNTKQRNALQRIVNFSSKIIYNQVRTLSVFCECDQQVLHKVEPIMKVPEHALYGGARTLTPWVPVQTTGTQNQQKRKLFCSHCS